MLQPYIAQDPRLIGVRDLAKEMYAAGSLSLHNYEHALWDTNVAIRIAKQELGVDVFKVIPAALLHDAGVGIGPYKDHIANGAKLARERLPDMDYNEADTEEIATAIFQHNGWTHTNPTSKVLFDADSLNKAGVHGIEQIIRVSKEFGTPTKVMPERFIPYIKQLIDSTFYTETAEQINIEMGNNQYNGLNLTLVYLQEMDRFLKEGNLTEKEILHKVNELFGVQHEA